MGWIKRQADEHQCNKPFSDYKVRVGDIWECDECYKAWIVDKVEFEDRPCGGVYITWSRWYTQDHPYIKD